MAAILPSRKTDETTGELRVRVYQRILGGKSDKAISYLVERSLVELEWFPSPKQCLEILADWREQHQEVMVRQQAQNLLSNEKRFRFNDWLQIFRDRRATQADVDRVSDNWREIAETQGYLRRNAETGAYTVREKYAAGFEELTKGLGRVDGQSD